MTDKTLLKKAYFTFICYAFQTFFIFSHNLIFAQSDSVVKIKPILAFYGAVSSSSDNITIKMTEDLYFSQISARQDFQIIDKRNEKYNAINVDNYKNSESISFYPEINEKNDGWECTLVAINHKIGKSFSETNRYESYYKILMDAKVTINDLLAKAYVSENFDSSSTQIGSIATSVPEISLEQLSGTWKGEDFIEKILILRGGRGFVIFKNGASMNISLSIEKNTVIVKQTSKTNASYFPELPRNVALSAAPTAAPIEWQLKIIDTNTLSGEKSTLKLSSSDSAEGAILPVKWIRQ
ncbi:MAG: hypothetical protein GX220_07240 [Treponema sp.]|nr:hypothetical protein [Treponema sp.]